LLSAHGKASRQAAQGADDCPQRLLFAQGQLGAAKEKLVAACKKYLTKHPGEVFFAAGTSPTS